MGGVAGKLPLGGKGVVEPLKHLVKGLAELPELRQDVLVDLHVRQIVHLHLLHLRGKAVQGLERMAADEVREHAAEKRHRRRDVPVGHAEIVLRPVNDDGELIVHPHGVGVKKDDLIVC